MNMGNSNGLSITVHLWMSQRKLWGSSQTQTVSHSQRERDVKLFLIFQAPHLSVHFWTNRINIPSVIAALSSECRLKAADVPRRPRVKWETPQSSWISSPSDRSYQRPMRHKRTQVYIWHPSQVRRVDLELHVFKKGLVLKNSRFTIR